MQKIYILVANLLLFTTLYGQNPIVSSEAHGMFKTAEKIAESSGDIQKNSFAFSEGDYVISNLENLKLEPATFWNGSDGSSGFKSGAAFFPNDYNQDYGTWSGWAYSNMSDDTTGDYSNQYSAITAAGMDTSLGHEIYAVSYVSPVSKIKFTDDQAHEIKGTYVTNSTYAALSMENGDQYAKEFGGETGDDPDWFLLSIWGYRDGQKTDSVNFYLADYRFEDNSKDYIVKSWKWVDLSPLGKVDSLAFGLSSSDTGQWGMNTPAYFCMDNLHIKDKAPVAINPVEDIQAKVSREDSTISLSDRYTDPDDEDNFSWEISVNSDSSVAVASIEGENLSISFKGEGQSNVVVKATNAGRSVKDTVIVGVLPQIEGEQIISDFENLDLEENSYWNGSDASGGFESGLAWLPNDYNPDNGNWSGWAYSNMADDTTAGDSNQYSAITAAGIDTGTGSKIYGVSYAAENPVIKLADSSSHQVKGMYITNSTYTALSMKYGNQFAKKFGGKTGNDPDWFKLSIWGKLNGNETDTIDFYLADFRFDDNSKDYIIQTWQWVELSSLGKVDSLMFALSSSDTGQWGMNTPAYFCMDNLRIVDEDPFVANPVADVSVYENAEDTIIDLSSVFSDPDNGDSTITKSVKSNSNIDLVEATISGNELTLSYTENATGEAEIVIQGQSGMKTVLDTFMVKVSEEVTGIDNTQPLTINVYPNPTNGRFKIDTKKGEKLSVRVYDLGGSVVYEEGHYTPEQPVDISDQPAGSYIIKVQKKNKTTNKLIIKR